MLDGGKVREVAKLDADRNLIHAVRTRQSSSDILPVMAETRTVLPPPAQPPVEDDYFAHAASYDVGELETTRW
jgi:hypothetical protein